MQLADGKELGRWPRLETPGDPHQHIEELLAGPELHRLEDRRCGHVDHVQGIADARREQRELRAGEELRGGNGVKRAQTLPLP